MTSRHALALLLLAGCSSTPEAPAPSIGSFTADAATVAPGQSTTLRWSVTNATSLSIDHGIGVVTGTSAVVTLADTTTYTLTATGSGGSTNRSTTVTVRNPHLQYDDPPAGGKLRLVRNAASTDTHLILDVQVGANALSAFGVALTLPMDPAKVAFTPASGLIVNASVLDPGSAPATAAAIVPTSGPLQNMLVVGVARKKQVATDGDLILPAGARLFSIAVDMNGAPTFGAVFTGSALVSPARAALLDKAGGEVASTADFAIGNLSISL